MEEELPFLELLEVRLCLSGPGVADPRRERPWPAEEVGPGVAEPRLEGVTGVIGGVYGF